MEKDIEILENVMERFRKAEIAELDDIEDLYERFDYEDYIAVKNLINRVKELEKINFKVNKNLLEIVEELDVCTEELTITKIELNELKKKYRSSISKDKIKAKIEEYNKMIKATYGDITHQGDIRRDNCKEIRNVLQELLKEE